MNTKQFNTQTDFEHGDMVIGSRKVGLDSQYFDRIGVFVGYSPHGYARVRLYGNNQLESPLLIHPESLSLHHRAGNDPV